MAATALDRALAFAWLLVASVADTGSHGGSVDVTSGQFLGRARQDAGPVLLPQGDHRAKVLTPSALAPFAPGAAAAAAPRDVERRARRSGDRHLTLLQDTGNASSTMSEGHAAGPLPLCHHAIVSRACGDKDSISKADLQRFLSANGSLIPEVWSGLFLPDDEETVKCQRLCWSVVAYVRRAGGVMPPACDIGCYTVNGHSKCSVNLSPPQLVLGMSTVVEDDLPDDGPALADHTTAATGGVEGLVRKSMIVNSRSFSRSGKNNTRTPMTETPQNGTDTQREATSSHWHHHSGQRTLEHCTYSMWEAVERIANMFRMYPASGREVPVSMPDVLRLQTAGAAEAVAEAADVQDEIAITNVRAKAWISTVLSEINAWQTLYFRQKWFGGDGSLSEIAVRERLLRTMNFIGRELLDGIHYVYPADDAVGSSCSGRVIGYVWKSVTDEEGYSETSGPICSASESPFIKQCGVDPDGNYFVYLCRYWFNNIDANSRIATLVHEASHHAGPSDVSYDRNTMQHFKQSQQLDNAANYQNFAQEVAQTAWGCPDSESVTGLPFTCNPSPCSCKAFSDRCDDAQYGASVRSQCPATCGACFGQSAPTPAPESSSCEDDGVWKDPVWHYTCSDWVKYRCTGYDFSSELIANCPRACNACATPTPAPTPCTESQGQQHLRIGNFPYTGTCGAFSSLEWCTEPSVREACPISCGVCTPAGCVDNPNYSIVTGLGALTCQDWKQYACWDEVKLECPTACNVPGCTR